MFQRVVSLAVLLAASLLIAGCVTQKQVDELTQSINETKAAVEAQPQTAETAKTLAVLDSAGNVVQRIPVIEDGATAGETITALSPLAGPYAPWVTLAGGVLAAFYAKRREDKAFDEGVSRGNTGEVKPTAPGTNN